MDLRKVRLKRTFLSLRSFEDLCEAHLRLGVVAGQSLKPKLQVSHASALKREGCQGLVLPGLAVRSGAGVASAKFEFTEVVF